MLSEKSHSDVLKMVEDFKKNQPPIDPNGAVSINLKSEFSRDTDIRSLWIGQLNQKGEDETIMGMKYCPRCRKVVLTKALQNYSQVDFKGIRGKRRKIVHLEEDGGCGFLLVYG